MVSDPRDKPSLDDAAWAHNRWPVIGLYTGGFVGFALGILFWKPWLITAVFLVAGLVLGTTIGWLLALWVYRHVEY